MILREKNNKKGSQFNFYFSEEFRKYKYLKYKEESREQLYEFLKFLEHQKCTTHGIDNCRVNFLLPFLVVILGEFFFELLRDYFAISDGFNIPITIVKDYFQGHTVNFGEWLVLTLAAIGVSLFMILILLVVFGGSFFYYLWEIMHDSLRVKYKYAFYDNYIRVIQGIMDAKNNESTKYEVHIRRIY